MAKMKQQVFFPQHFWASKGILDFMVSTASLNSDTICDLTGQPLNRQAAALLKAVDKLLTVGAYYSADHDQYRVVSEKSCEQMVAAIGPDQVMAIEITASGMMIRSQLLDPNHRNVRLLHDLLVPLNIARLEISSGLSPADLRQAIAALQFHRQNLGNTEGFKEIKIDNLPSTVSTASRNVVHDHGDGGELTEDQIASLDDLFGSGFSSEGNVNPDALLSDSERLAQEFMEVVGQILQNLEQDQTGPDEDGSTPHPDSTPENIKVLREALRRLVEVKPDPGDLARLIEHAKRALNLSNDPRSVDLVFSLLKKEVEIDGDWKYNTRKKTVKKPPREFNLTLEQLGQSVSELETEGSPLAEPMPSALGNYLAICFRLLAADPSEVLESNLVANLEQALAGPEMTRLDMNICSAAVATSARIDNQIAIDRVLPAFCGPLRLYRPEYLATFWAQFWKTLCQERRPLVWPFLVSDLLEGLDHPDPEVVARLWRAAGELEPKLAVAQVSRLESTPALRKKSICPSLMKQPLASVFPVHAALMLSSQAPQHGARLHHHLLRRPPNKLIWILMKALGKYNPDNKNFYLSLIQQSGSSTITPDLRRTASRLLRQALADLPVKNRQQEWVVKAIGWLVKLDRGLALPLLNQIISEKRFFLFKAWPAECRGLAREALRAEPSHSAAKEER